jgi:fatty acid desaturase
VSLKNNHIDWYRTPIDSVSLTRLTKRSDMQGFIHVFAHLILLFVTGSVSYWSYLNDYYLLALITLFIHGNFYSFLGWAGAGHELIHKTVFKTKIYNDFFLFLFAFLTWNNYVYFRASHIRHHKFTVFDGLDCEVRLPQKLSFSSWLWALTFNFPACYRSIKIVLENSFCIIKGKWGDVLFSDLNKRKKVINCARMVLLGHIILIIVFIVSHHWHLLLLVTFAPFISDWLNKVLALAQHFGMQPNTNDFRLNSRTVLLHPFIQFLYWQMNYHIEHHMYPGVTFFNLKKLRNEIEYDLPVATLGITNLVKEILLHKE